MHSLELMHISLAGFLQVSQFLQGLFKSQHILSLQH